MSGLSEFLDPRCVDLDLRGNKKSAVIEELVLLLQKTGGVRDARGLTKELLERERLSSTGIGEGAAIPHVLSDAVERTFVAFGRSRNGVGFESADRKPVHLIFLMAGPAGATGTHLKLLSRLARLLRDPGFRAALMSAETPEELVGKFKEQEAS